MALRPGREAPFSPELSCFVATIPFANMLAATGPN